MRGNTDICGMAAGTDPLHGTVEVTLEPWEYEWACHVGIRRYTANWGKKDAHYYRKERMEDDRTAQQVACVAELAVAKHTNRFWSGTVWAAGEHKNNTWRPDVGRNIEVRHIRKPTSKAAVRRKQLGQGLVLWVAYPVRPECRSVHLLGWLPMDDAWEAGEPADYDSSGDTRVVPHSALRSPNLPR